MLISLLDWRPRLRNELIRRHEARGSAAIRDGELAVVPVESDTVADRRNRAWPGYHTEYCDLDVRH